MFGLAAKGSFLQQFAGIGGLSKLHEMQDFKVVVKLEEKLIAMGLDIGRQMISK